MVVRVPGPSDKPVEHIETARPQASGSDNTLVPKEIKAREPEVEGEKRAHPILTDEDYQAAIAKARAKIEKQRRDAAMKAVEEQEMERLRMEEGMVTGGGPGDDMVSITMDLAEHSPFVLINGRPYWHTQTYTVPRHVADTLRDTMFRGHKHQNDIDGKSLTSFYQKQRGTVISKTRGAINAPSMH